MSPWRVVIGVSGSPDYLRDQTGSIRHWPSRVEAVRENLDAAEVARIARFVRQQEVGDLVPRTVAPIESKEID